MHSCTAHRQDSHEIANPPPGASSSRAGLTPPPANARPKPTFHAMRMHDAAATLGEPPASGARVWSSVRESKPRRQADRRTTGAWLRERATPHAARGRDRLPSVPAARRTAEAQLGSARARARALSPSARSRPTAPLLPADYLLKSMCAPGEAGPRLEPISELTAARAAAAARLLGVPGLPPLRSRPNTPVPPSLLLSAVR